MGNAALCRQCSTLGNAKAVLFICNHQTQFLILHVFLKNGMRADQQLQAAVCQLTADAAAGWRFFLLPVWNR